MEIIEKKIYLAIPFSGIEETSFICANEAASLLIAQGHYVFSPISHSYPIWKTNLVPHTYDVWMRQDRAFVEWCEEVWVVIIEGAKFNGQERVDASKGVQIELGWAKELGKTIRYIHYDLLDRTINECR